MSYHSAMNTARQPDYKGLSLPDDPRVLMLAFALILFFAFIPQEVSGLVLLLLYVLVLYRIAGYGVGSLVGRLRHILLLVALVIGLNGVLVQGDPLPRPLHVFSGEGLTNGLYYGLRVLVLYFSMVVLLSLISPEGVAQGLSTLVKPFSSRWAQRFALYGFLAIGFLPLFAQEFERIRTAQRFRGAGLDGGLIRKLDGMRLLLLPLILSAVHRSAQLAMVVELRGIESSIGRLLVGRRPSAREYLFLVVTAVVVTCSYFSP
jgi:energy-coupling factor transporter transmembrane protein EcfT